MPDSGQQVYAEGTVVSALVVGFCAGPGAGKSTMAAHVFALLKWAGIRAELVTEFAKDCYWEQRPLPSAFYVLAKQYHRLARVVPRVDVVVTDSPLLLGLAYTDDGALHQLVRQYAREFRNLYILLERRKPYDQTGRWQLEPDAITIDRDIQHILSITRVSYRRFLAVDWAAKDICEVIQRRLENDKHASQEEPSL